MKVHLYKILLLFLSFYLSSNISAQVTISGNILDAETGMGIPGASIVEKGTINGTTSDIDGNYSLEVSLEADTLLFSYIGYVTMEIPIQARQIIDVTMEAELTELDEVVVIGYGTQKKKVVTGAIATVNAKEIERIPVLRAEQAMQGRTAGVQVTQMSGQPGETPTVRIRGTGTTGYAEPLYIVDGIPVGGIDYLNPGDIESMDVLKDAASAAIYGARAANGVVLITTKSGKSGKMNVSFSAYYGIQNPYKQLDMLTPYQYKRLMNEGAINGNPNLSELPFDLNEITQDSTDWQKELFQRNAPMMNYDLSLTGGNDVSTYASSFSYFSQEGIIGGSQSQYDRITARINSKHKVSERFTFGNNLAYSHMTRRGIASNTSFNGAFSSALNMDPLTPLYETDSATLSQTPYSDQPVVIDEQGNIYGISKYTNDGEIVNPLALLETQNGQTTVDKVVGNLFAELEIIEGLEIRTNFGIDLAYVGYDDYRDLYYLNGAQKNIDKTDVSKSYNRYFKWIWENTLSYTKKINDHQFSALIGTTAEEQVAEDLYGFNADVKITDPDNVYLNMATDTVWRAYGGAWESALFSVFGRATYDFKGRYAFTGILRRDGSSKFGSNNRYGIFPSVGVSWLLSEEAFMPNLGPVSFIKIRSSWGINGNQEIGNYQYISVIDKSRGYIFGSGRGTGASPLYVENKDIKWEESEQFNVALDFGMFNDRLTGSIDYYIKNTWDLLETIRIPAHVGNDPSVANVGSIRNEGVELAFRWRHTINDLRYQIGLNTAYNKNTVTEIGNESNEINGATWATSGFVTRSEEGMPYAYFYGYQSDGIFQSEAEVYSHIGSTGAPLQPDAVPGDVRFVDVNNDGVLDEDDRTMIGDPTPDWTLGFDASFEYKNFDLSFLFVGAFGHEIFNGSQRQDLQYTNRTTEILDRWTPENPSNEIPRYTWSDINKNYRVSDLYVENGSYMRLRNLQIGYTLPRSVLNSIKAVTWRFYVSAENLWTITGYSGADPEIGVQGAFDVGIDRGIYPQARAFRFGTSITF